LLPIGPALNTSEVGAMNRATGWLPRLGSVKSRKVTQTRKLHFERLEPRDVPSATLALDFNTDTSPTAAGYTGVTLANYTPATHLGGQSITGLGASNRSLNNALNRDFHWGQDATFLADVPNGTYDLVVGLGDASVVRDRIWVWAEGSVLASEVTGAAGQFLQVRGRVTVSDGTLTLRIADAGGTTPNFAIDSLVLTATNPNAHD